MKSTGWLRALAVLLGLFALGHTLGTAAPKVTRGPPEAALFAAMRGYRFSVMGFDRSYWEFYRGFALTISVLMLVMSAFAWQSSQVSRRSAREALPMAVTLLVGCVGLLLVGWEFFFTAPIVLSLLSVALAAMAVGLLTRESVGAQR